MKKERGILVGLLPGKAVVAVPVLTEFKNARQRNGRINPNPRLTETGGGPQSLHWGVNSFNE